VHITSTDSRLRDLHPYIPWIFQSWNWTVFKKDILDSSKDERGVCLLWAAHDLVGNQGLEIVST
jgi:hypothetical protein